jgi:electron transfer flavoprotein beta subunit
VCSSGSMNLIVCVRQILDPETPAAAFKVDPEVKRAIPPNDRSMVISDYDANAMEAALRIKDSLKSRITVISLGSKSAKNVIRRCIAMGADEGVLLSDPLFDDSDSFATAFVLAKTIKKLGDFDLILCGRQEGDWDAGQVGSGIAELLDIPSVSMISDIEINGETVVVERVLSDGRELVELPLPALVTVSSEIGEPRYPPFRRVMEASKKEIPTWNAQDVTPTKARNKILSLFVPPREVKCEFIIGETLEDAATNLALKLKEIKAI